MDGGTIARRGTLKEVNEMQGYGRTYEKKREKAGKSSSRVSTNLSFQFFPPSSREFLKKFLASLLEKILTKKYRSINRLDYPPGSFTIYLTLSSEYFSTFPHGTCSLSVSQYYLALDGVDE